MNFPEAVLPEDFTSPLADSQPSFSVTLKDFTDPASNLENLAKRPKLLKGLMHQMKHSQQEFLQREQGLTRLLEDGDKKNSLQTILTFTYFIL